MYAFVWCMCDVCVCDSVLLVGLMLPVLRRLGLRAFSMASDSYSSGTHSAAFVTCPNDTVAKELARGIVEKKLAACVNIIPQITSSPINNKNHRVCVCVCVCV
uniref:CutA divalent cation tolerance homolog n=1 Tax=Sinocyclocheilus grahami TaxID=75366 RepID=A0A672Q5Y0_SINGR